MEDLREFWDKVPKLDIETTILFISLFILSRISVSIFPSTLVTMVVAIFPVCLILVVGYKISFYIVKNREDCFQGLTIALILFVSLIFVYVSWISIATFSSFAPTITLMLSFLLLLIPPKLTLHQKAIHVVKEYEDKTILGLFLMLVAVLTISTVYVSAHPIQTWVTTIFDGITPLIIIVIGISVLIVLLLLLKKSPLWWLALGITVLWIKSMLLMRGIVQFGGDGGVNLAAIQYLLDGENASFLWTTGEYYNWRSGSIASLVFQSNMAFMYNFTGVTASYSSLAFVTAFTTIFLILGVYSLASCITDEKSISALGTSIVVLLVSSIYWWEYTLTPNGLVQCLGFAYIAFSVYRPNTKKGMIIFIGISTFIFLVHPSAFILIIPCSIYQIFRNRISETDWKSILVIFTSVYLLILTILVTPGILSATSAFDIPIYGWDALAMLVPNSDFTSSVFYNSFASSFLIPLLFALLGILAYYFIRSRVQLNKSLSGYFFITLLLLLEIATLDIAFLTPSIDITYRYWPFVISLCVLIPAIIVASYLLHGSDYRTHNTEKQVHFKFEYSKKVATIALVILVTNSIVLSAHPIGQNLNMDSITYDELDFLSSFFDSTNLSNSIVLAESPMWRYLRGMANDWPPTKPTFYNHIINETVLNRESEFANLVYYNNPGPLSQLFFEERVGSIYIIVMTRFSNEKAEYWYNGRAYIDRLPTIGKILMESQVGYILEITRNDFTHLPLDDWNISWNQLANFTFTSETDRLKFQGDFPDRLLSFGAARDLSAFSYSDFKGFYVRYNGSSESGAPVIRIRLGLENGTLLELQPYLMQKTEITTYYSNLGENSTITSIVVSMDSGTERLYWNGPGSYYFEIFDIYVAPW